MQATIIGLGLIGGSLGMALKRAQGQNIEVVGFARKSHVAEQALNIHAIDRSANSLASSVVGSDIVFVCTPVLAIEEVLRNISAHVSPGCLVTDTAGTKQQVMVWARQHLYPRTAFVGGHPMAGKEKPGIEFADPDLLRGCAYCLTPSEWATPEAVRMAGDVVAWVGARPLFIEASRHDFLVAGISHLPTLVSAAVVAATTRSPDWADMAPLAATGYRDVTRLASGSPKVSGETFITNRQALAFWTEELTRILTQLKDEVLKGDSLEATLERICEARERWLETKANQKCDD